MDEIVCPYCGYEFGDSWEYKDGGQTDCPECNKEFNYDINYSVDYTTSKIQCKGEHKYVFDSPYISYEDYNYKENKTKVKPESEWNFIEIQKCELCDNKTFKKTIPREEWISKYSEKWEMYQRWIKQDRDKESING